MTKLDFTILKDLSSSRILFLDTSDYSSSPVSPTLHIKFPDFKKEYSTPIRFGEINIINTSMLKFSEYNVDFQDGIYDMTYEINNKKCLVNKKIFITASAFSCLESMLEDSTSYNKDLLDKFNKINLYLHGAEASVDNEKQALALYKQANDLLKCSNNNVWMRKSTCSSCI